MCYGECEFLLHLEQAVVITPRKSIIPTSNSCINFLRQTSYETPRQNEDFVSKGFGSNPANRAKDEKPRRKSCEVPTTTPTENEANFD